MENNFESLVGKLDNKMINTHIKGYETSDIPTEKKREIYKYYLEKEFPQFAEEIYNLTEASFIDEETEMDWKEFANLEEVQVDQSPSGTGNALFYNDENIVVSVEISGDHDDTSIWEDEELIRELQELVEAGYDDMYSSIRPLSKSGKEVS